MKKFICIILSIFTVSSSTFAQQEDIHHHESSSHTHSHEQVSSHDHSHETLSNHDHQIKTLETYTLVPRTFINTIQTTGMLKVSPKNETLLIATSNGVIRFKNMDLATGSKIGKSESIFTISGNNMIKDNLDIHFLQMKNAYLMSKENYNRAKILLKDTIISQKEFLTRKFQFEADSSTYSIMKKSYETKSLQVLSPINGQIFELFVKNGEFVTAGQKLASITNNEDLYLEVLLPKQYFTEIESINSGTFKPEYEETLYSFKSSSKIATANQINPGSPYIPITFKIDNNSIFLPGSFTNVWLNISKIPDAMVIPKSALIEQQGLYFVFREMAPEDYHKVQVEVETINAYEAKISSGLHLGDIIVIDGVLELKLIQSAGTIDPHAGHSH